MIFGSIDFCSGCGRSERWKIMCTHVRSKPDKRIELADGTGKGDADIEDEKERDEKKNMLVPQTREE